MSENNEKIHDRFISPMKVSIDGELVYEPAAAADEAGRKKGFQRSITDAISRGLTATQAIGDAVKRML